MQHQLVISEITPCEGSSYFPLPKELRDPIKGSWMTAKDYKDNECFRSCLVRHLNPVSKNPAKMRNAEQLDFKGVKSSVHKKRLC